MTSDPDEALVAKSRAGDHRAFADLVRRHRERVFRLAVSILGRGHAGEAEEVTQEVFVRAHRGLPAFRGDSAFGSWVYRITFNQALNVKARLRHRAAHVPDDVLADVPAPDGSPDQRLQEVRRHRALEACVAELPDVYQSALRLHYWTGADVGEIALLLGVPENTVKSYMHRARRLLRVMLRERGYDTF